MRLSASSFSSGRRKLAPTFAVAFLTLALGLTGGASSHAAESAVATTERDQAWLVSDSDTVQPGQPIRVGLHLALKPTWHTYWRNPGDAGEAPTLAVTLSGAASGHGDAIAWPAPERLPDGPLMSYGYTGDVLLPVTVTPVAGTSDAQDVTVKAHAEWLVCAAVCVPEQGDFQMTLHSGAAAPSAQAPLFERATAARPLPSPFTSSITPTGLLQISGKGLSREAVSEAWFVPGAPGVVDQVADQKLTFNDEGLSLSLKPLDGFKTGSPLEGVLLLRDKAGQQSALDMTAQPAKGSVASASAPAGRLAAASWGELAVLAFLGGAILNLMPCVFPVLAMKALAVVRLGGEAARVRSALAYTAGVLVTFALLGGATLAVRGAGVTAGWGFQFQSPAFVAIICWLLFGVGLGMLGVFEMPAIGAGQGAISRAHGGLADFLTGLLAVLVATPCTAPFMGAAVAGALAAPPLAAIGVFLCMGLGLASPYLLLAVVPGFGRLIPKPGAWMDIFRQLLAFPIFATCVWLAWVLARQGGGDAVLLLGVGLLLLGFSGWLVINGRALTMRGASGARWVRGLAVIAAVAPLALLLALPAPASAPTAGVSAEQSAFSEARLAALRAQGRPVFIDMTAAWCITCLVNERVTLSSAKVQDAFAKNNVAYIKGDWTNRDEAITAFLRAHGRDGVPLYVYFPPHAEGRVLPQILTPDLVIGAMKG
ncbi:cytochrome c biogenesis thiol:disulfide interchange protein DsbD [Acetobacter nitrogenifigens DSM 23921 = NBRC 105050]|uniref:Thiol:disulfide interchange protein DsbD n=1 Tax=Acetobacter nitrogenifigens DSM 23921 = NBRC 105050 TaxID=1120919 RepID=A0A511XCR1_9PROT|nr:thioredoxin family protein [Acetobacter nitrogenifigens]GBQ87667.1 cytochrome c biogenesis thiol:disulfide interchange protein DsbD [Acetobacter nitrogenifigens DSM 23921 = NBRC 105050]GEN60665.1 thiol:disulfide interchange protein DsbD [Acetobacter nitrogenifigens DSM 23921 = NBRC 105050]